MYSNTDVIREGDLYEVIEIYGKRFEIRYGYYEDFEREHTEPIPIYPLFYEKPMYSTEGYPLATKIQEPCNEYTLRNEQIDNERCADCIYFNTENDKMIGICKCKKRRLNIEREEKML